jgi:hypothetical protein
MKTIQDDEFKKLMQRIAEAWSVGNAVVAASYFTEKALFEFCGGHSPKPPLQMIWRHLAFDEPKQVGYGKYVFQQFVFGERSVQIKNSYHGIVWVKVEDGKISGWREYRL